MWIRCAWLSLVVLAQARGQGDPAAFASKLDAALKTHPFFSKVDFTVDASHPPYRFYVQRPAKDDPLYVRGMVNTYLPFVEEQRRLFVEEYATPLGLVQSAEMPVYAIAILASGGSYADFARAVGNQGLHMARAHYDPVLRLAVTYQDAFAGYATGSEERQAMLHEFVHALQHAYSATGAMPKATWYAEGLAEYRSTCTNMPNTLRELAEREVHLDTMASVCVRPGLRPLVAPVAELVAATSYQDVLEAAKKRGSAVPAQLCLQVFYAESEMFVRFLDQGLEGKYRAGFRRYLAAVQKGGSGKDAFAQALGDGKPADFAALENDWFGWLTGRLRERHGARYPDLRAAIGTAGPVMVPLAPPSPFDPSVLAWQPAEAMDRIAAGRRLCARGEYEAALQVLPSAADVAGQPAEAVARERERVLALVEFRDALLAEDEQKKTSLTFKVGGAEVKGRLVRREEGSLVLAAGSKESRVALAAVRPEWLLKAGQRQNRFDGANRWLDPWVRWLNGQKHNAIRQQLQGDNPRLAALRSDLTGDLDANYGAAALALVDLQRLCMPAAGAPAKQELERVLAMVKAVGKEPLFQARTAGVEQLVRALCERAFTLDDPRALGLRGKGETLEGGRIKVRYPGPFEQSCEDFALQKDPDAQLPHSRLSYDGPTQLAPGQDGMQLIGSGVLHWAMPLRGRQEYEVGFELQGDMVSFGLVVCADKDNGLIMVEPDGTVAIYDRKSGIADRVGSSGPLYRDEKHRLRVVHDGEKKLEVFFDGMRTALLPDVGARVRGAFGFYVHSSTAVVVREILVSGVPDPPDPTALREQYVTAVLAGLWP